MMSAIQLHLINQLSAQLDKIINDVNPISWYSEAATTDLNAYLKSTQRQYELSKTKIERYIIEISQYANEWKQSIESETTTAAELNAFNEAIKDPKSFFSTMNIGKDIVDEINANLEIIDAKLRSTATPSFSSITTGHFSRSCSKKQPFHYCRSSGHHQALCNDAQSHQSVATGDQRSISNNQQSNRQLTMTAAVDSITTQTLLPTAYAEAFNPVNPEVRYTAVILFDNGSDNTYVTTELAQKLNLPTVDRKSVTINGIGETTIQNAQIDIVDVQLSRDDEPIAIRALVVPKSTHRLLTVAMPSKLSAQGNTIPLLMHSAPASVLIGVDQMNEVINLLSVKKLPSGFTLLESRLRMVLNGRGETTLLKNQAVIDSFTVMTSTSNDPLKQFWKLELMGITENPPITVDDVAIQKFREGTKFNDGRYYIRWRWKEGELLLRETECQTGKATDEIRHILDGISRNSIVITVSVVVILTLIAGLIISTKSLSRSISFQSPVIPRLNHSVARFRSNLPLSLD